MSTNFDTELLTRFYRLYDSVIAEVNLAFPAYVDRKRVRGLSASILVDTRDSAANGAWVRVRLDLSEVSEYALRDPSNHLAINVLSDGLYILREGNLVLLDFAPKVVDPVTIDDFRNSHLYFGCAGFSWTVVASSN